MNEELKLLCEIININIYRSLISLSNLQYSNTKNYIQFKFSIGCKTNACILYYKERSNTYIIEFYSINNFDIEITKVIKFIKLPHLNKTFTTEILKLIKLRDSSLI